MTFRLTLNADDGSARSWVLATDESSTVSEVAEAIGVDLDWLAPGAEREARPADVGLESGSSIRRGGIRASRDLLPAGTVRLEVVGGPGSGAIVALAAGAVVRIGSGAGLDLTLPDPDLAAVHATAALADAAPAAGRPAPLRAVLAVEPGAAPLVVNGEPAGARAEIVPADLVQVGSSILRLGVAPAPDADLSRDESGARGFNRPSRIRAPRRVPTLVLPGDRPKEQDASPLPWLSALVPVVLGVTMATVFQRPIMLLMAAAAPIMVLGSFFANRRLAKRRGIRTDGEWAADLARARDRIGQLVREQRLDAWYRLLDPVAIADIARRPLARLWERRRADADALVTRVGVAEVPLDIALEGGSPRDRGDDAAVGVSPSPVAVDLATGPAGLAGPGDVVRGLARSMVTALATLRSPRDLRLVVLCDEERERDWAWTGWLPHARGRDSAVALVGNTDLTRRERLRELGALLDARAREGGDRSIAWSDQVVVVVDEARRFRSLPGMVALLERGSRFGIHVIALESDAARLPEECASTLIVDGGDPTLARLEASDGYRSTVLLDAVAPEAAEEIARALCSIEHVAGIGDDAVLPSSVRFTELLGLDLTSTAPILEQWRLAPRRSHVVVGAGLEGEFALDIAADGPHALVAGMTGSGKSEFLQTLVVALALANRPDALQFVLVDYKGGSAFADCARLPHTVGDVTNLDAAETERALASFDAEIKRRERVLLDEIKAKDVDAAWAKDPEAASRHGLARLMIVVDEFAELKDELPDFVSGLVRIARVGRALGIHLVLATQRPSGVVTPDMQANMAMRVALRVADRVDSADIIGTSEAAFIPAGAPGRGYVRLGQDSAPQPFQTARVANLRSGHQRVTRVLPPAAEVDWTTLGLPPRYPATATAAHRPDQDDTDLRALVALIGEAAQEAGIPRGASPWLLPLPAVLPLDRLDAAQAGDDAVLLGLEDVPGEQAQRVLSWSVADDSHVLFLGGALSGRTTALRTILAQAVQRFTPADLHLYIADYGNGALLPFAQAPHTGAVVTAAESGRLSRMMERLLDDLTARQRVLSAAGVGGIAEQRRSADPASALPYALVVVDGWERLTGSLSTDEVGVVRDQMLRLLREGPAVGVRVLVTADRGVMSDKISTFLDTRYVLRLRDVAEYRAAGIMVRQVDAEMPPGRILFGADAAVAQLAVVSPDPAGEAQTAAVRGIVQHVAAHFARFPELADLPQAWHIDPLPEDVPFSAVGDLPVAGSGMPEVPVVAVGGDRLSRYTLAWPELGGFVVVGEPRSGKSSTLALLAHQLAWARHPVVTVAAASSPLAEVAAEHGLARLDGTATADDVTAALAAVAGTGRRTTVVIDDAESWRGTPLESALMAARDGVVFAASVAAGAAATTVTGPFAEAKRGQSGILLSPGTSILGTQVFGAQLPRVLVGRRSPGGGVLRRDGDYLPIRVPDVRR